MVSQSRVKAPWSPAIPLEAARVDLVYIAQVNGALIGAQQFSGKPLEPVEATSKAASHYWPSA
jgi:hypothetical protein